MMPIYEPLASMSSEAFIVLDSMSCDARTAPLSDAIECHLLLNGLHKTECLEANTQTITRRENSVQLCPNKSVVVASNMHQYLKNI